MTAEPYRVVVACDSFGGTLTAPQACEAVMSGWRRIRPDDAVTIRPLSDGGEGLLDALLAGGIADADDLRTTEVADARGLPTDARWLLLDRPTGPVAIIESAEACGLASVPSDRRDPMTLTTWGVGQLLDAAREAGARRILVGLGGSATVDGGSGALTGLGLRLRVGDGQGLKMGGGELGAIDRVERGWMADWAGVEVELLADVTTPLHEAAATFGPQKGADARAVAQLSANLARWARVVARDLAADGLDTTAGSGAAGGLGYGLAAAIGARFVPGAAAVAELVGLAGACAGADLVVTGEGRLDATSAAGKVVGHVCATAEAAETPVAAVVGQVADHIDGLVDVEESAPSGPGSHPAAEVSAAAARLATRAGVVVDRGPAPGS